MSSFVRYVGTTTLLTVTALHVMAYTYARTPWLRNSRVGKLMFVFVCVVIATVIKMITKDMK